MGADPKSCIDVYWSADTCFTSKCVIDTVSKNLFKDIHRVFHVDDLENASHALKRVNYLLLNMKEKSKKLFNLHENLSISEAMIKFHVRHSGIVDTPNQPAKEIIKSKHLQMDILAMFGTLKYIYVHPNGRRDSPRELWKRCAKKW